MPETNGNRDARLDRIERALELIIDDHERFRADLRQLLTAQVLQKDALERHDKELQLLRDSVRETNQSVTGMVSAIRQLLDRIPPENLR